MRVIQRLPRLGLLLLILAATDCGERRAAFDDTKAQIDIAAAFQRPSNQVAIYSSEYGTGENDWIVEFRVDGDGGLYQARFSGATKVWVLRELRQRSEGGEYGAWVDPKVLRLQTVKVAGTKVRESMDLMRELSILIERYATDNGGQYPATDLAGLHDLIVNGGYTTTWRHDADAWGGGLLFHASTEGDAYLIVSGAADGRFDLEPAEYFAKTDQGDEIYGGAVSDPALDIVFATGAFVQNYSPAE